MLLTFQYGIGIFKFCTIVQCACANFVFVFISLLCICVYIVYIVQLQNRKTALPFVEILIPTLLKQRSTDTKLGNRIRLCMLHFDFVCIWYLEQLAICTWETRTPHMKY